MFCKQCGESLEPDVKFCGKCGAAISKQDSSKPESSLTDLTQNNAIWNPDAASNWSIIFTPAFGSYLHAMNWQTLGENDRAKSSMGWFYLSLAMLAVYFLMGLSMPKGAAKGAALLLSLLYLTVWYFSVGKAQSKFVKDKFGSDYPRRKWGKPLLICVAAIVGYKIAVMVIGFIVGITN